MFEKLHFTRLGLRIDAPILWGVLILLFSLVPGSHAFAQIFVEETESRITPIDNGYSWDAEVIDVNNDGALDIFIASGGGQNRLYINDGSGVFTEVTQTQLPADSSGNRMAISADIDGDGDIDIFTPHRSGGTTPAHLLYVNDGAGTFTEEAVSRLPAVLPNYALATDFADVDADGDQDLLLWGWPDTGPLMMFNDGSGDFTTQPAGLPFAHVQFARFGDLNADGDPDIFAGSGESFFVLINDGTGTFSDVARGPDDAPFTGDDVFPFSDYLSSSTNGEAVDYADFDSDGDTDIAVAIQGLDQFILLYNQLSDTGVFVFQNARSRITATIPIGNREDLDAVDIDGDGNIDIIISEASNRGTNLVLLNDGTGSFPSVDQNFPGFNFGQFWNLVLGDLDGDGDPDLVLPSSSQSNVRIFVNTTPPDSDSDGILDAEDNAPNDPNPDQSDIDMDGVGDVADPCPSDPTDSCDPSGSAAESIGTDGGMVATDDGDVAVTIPAGALDGDTSISLTDMGEDFVLASSVGQAVAIFGVEIQPEGTVFNVPITLVFAWDDTDNDAKVDGTNIQEKKLIITKDDVAITDQCQFEPGCDTVANTFTFSVTSLSEFTLAGPLDTDNDGVPDDFAGQVDVCPNEDSTGLDIDGDGCIDQCVPPQPAPQGYWHRQCLGVPALEGGIDPGRDGRGPESPTEPDFVDKLMDCTDAKLDELLFYGVFTCDGMDADPANDNCEKATKQATALILNVCSGRVRLTCGVDLAAEGCSSTDVVSLLNELAGYMLAGSCQQAHDCAAAANDGIGLGNGGGGGAVAPAQDDAERDRRIKRAPIPEASRGRTGRR